MLYEETNIIEKNNPDIQESKMSPVSHRRTNSVI